MLAAIVLGLAVGSPSPLYPAALHTIAKGHPGTGDATVDVLVLAALVLLLAEIPIVLFLLAPQRSTRALEESNAWLGRHGRMIAVVAAGVVGCYFVVNGVVRLA